MPVLSLMSVVAEHRSLVRGALLPCGVFAKLLFPFLLQFLSGKPLIQFWQKLLSPQHASSKFSPETLLDPEQDILGPGFGWSIIYL